MYLLHFHTFVYLGIGDVPFSDTHSSEIVARLMDGYRLPKPEKAIEL